MEEERVNAWVEHGKLENRSTDSCGHGRTGAPVRVSVAPLAAQPARESDAGKRIVPYVPTPQDVVERMLELAQVKKGDVVYDLGSGDGRIVITAARKYGVRAIGFEIDPDRIKESRENIKKAGVEKLVDIRQQDIRTVDLSPASVLTLYLLPEVNLMIRPNIWKQMKPGSRVVSHDFDMGDWKPLKAENIKDSSGWDHTLYLWHVEPGKK